MSCCQCCTNTLFLGCLSACDGVLTLGTVTANVSVVLTTDFWGINQQIKGEFLAGELIQFNIDVLNEMFTFTAALTVEGMPFGVQDEAGNVYDCISFKTALGAEPSAGSPALTLTDAPAGMVGGGTDGTDGDGGTGGFELKEFEYIGNIDTYSTLWNIPMVQNFDKYDVEIEVFDTDIQKWVTHDHGGGIYEKTAGGVRIIVVPFPIQTKGRATVYERQNTD